jgi:hypothetical protein
MTASPRRGDDDVAIASTSGWRHRSSLSTTGVGGTNGDAFSLFEVWRDWAIAVAVWLLLLGLALCALSAVTPPGPATPAALPHRPDRIDPGVAGTDLGGPALTRTFTR